MTRLPRIVLPGQPQLILQNGHRAQTIFRGDDDYRFYLETLREAAQRYGGEVHAYALMPDHVHLLLTPHAEDSIARILQQVGRSFARYLNSVYLRSGSLWDGRYKAAIIDSEHYLLACYRYIELDPVRTLWVDCADDYPWSSYCAHALGAPDSLIRDHVLYQALGPTREARVGAYRALFNARLDEQCMRAIQEAMLSGWMLGNEEFKAQLLTALEQRSAQIPAPIRRDSTGEVLREK